MLDRRPVPLRCECSHLAEWHPDSRVGGRYHQVLQLVNRHPVRPCRIEQDGYAIVALPHGGHLRAVGQAAQVERERGLGDA